MHALGEGLADLLELRPSGHLLGVDGGLDAVEETFEPAHELSLRDAEFCVRRSRFLGEGQGEALELFDELRRQTGLQLLDRGLGNHAKSLGLVGPLPDPGQQVTDAVENSLGHRISCHVYGPGNTRTRSRFGPDGAPRPL